MKAGLGIRHFLVALCSALLFPQVAQAVEVNGVKIDDTARVANFDLKLNGAGVRTKLLFKVYVAGIYLTDKKTTTADVLAAPGPKRIILSMLRKVDSDSFGQAFMEGMHNNSTIEERASIVNQMFAFGHMFGSYHNLNPGDVVTVDWVPNQGTIVQLNGKQISEPLPDVAFYNALLKIWLGDQPADRSLKKVLLGGK
ncbi:MAG: chalcone isomerase family protein [Burkholderiales bacterium]|nr:chalcone isomerase family protein [Burkholderiales bacterium]